jgi:hypothetical protein
MKQRYTDDELINAVQTSVSIRQVLSKLGLVEAGGNYSIIKRRIQSLKVDMSHFTGKGWRGGSRNPVVTPKPISVILQRGVAYQSYKLKRRLFVEGLKTQRCENCSGSEWMGQPIPLELDHINGDSTDNRIENLRILCPNCHALTETYRGRKLAKCRDETAPS